MLLQRKYSYFLLISINSIVFKINKIFEMKAAQNLNLMGEYLLFKNKSLGKGATGEVFLGKEIKTSKEVAIKMINLKTIDNEVTKYLHEMQKIAVMSINNEHALKGIKIIQNQFHCFIVTELYNGGSLKNYIRFKGPLPEEISLKFLKQILKAECGLVSKGIIHRDLKPANILLHNNNEIKVIDFGYSEIRGYKKPEIEYNVGSPSYMAPEAFQDNQYSEKTEIWAIGVTFYECLNGKTFDQGKNMNEIFRKIKKTGIPYKASVSEKCKKIIGWCLDSSPSKRPTCLQLLNYLTAQTIEKTHSSQSVRVPQSAPNSVENTERSKFQFIPKTVNMMAKDIQSDYYGSNPSVKVIETKKPAFENRPKTIYSTYEPPHKAVFLNQKVGMNPPSSAKSTKSNNKINFLQIFSSRTPVTSKRSKAMKENVQFQKVDLPKSRNEPYRSTRPKVLSKPMNHMKSVNVDYYGTLTNRM